MIRLKEALAVDQKITEENLILPIRLLMMYLLDEKKPTQTNLKKQLTQLIINPTAPRSPISCKISNGRYYYLKTIDLLNPSTVTKTDCHIIQAARCLTHLYYELLDSQKKTWP